MARTEGNEIRGILVEITEKNYIESFSLAKIYIFMAIVKDFHVKMRLASFCCVNVVKDGAYYCYCAYVLRISRYSDFLSVMLTNTGIFLRGLKLSGESRS